jgi:hypothetical protein
MNDLIDVVELNSQVEVPSNARVRVRQLVDRHMKLRHMEVLEACARKFDIVELVIGPYTQFASVGMSGTAFMNGQHLDLLDTLPGDVIEVVVRNISDTSTGFLGRLTSCSPKCRGWTRG